MIVTPVAATEMAHPATLSSLLDGMATLPERFDPPVRGLSEQSSEVVNGGLFVALAGRAGHGLDQLAQAVARGAVAVVADAADQRADTIGNTSLPLIRVERLRQRLATIAARFHGEPAQRLAMIGVTGTNGKSSVTTLVAGALERLGTRCGVIGTLGSGRYGALAAATHTTPPAIALQRLLAGLVGEGCEAAAVEVSSHALDQGRVGAISWRVAAFTNLGRDHLDYHGSEAAYRATKRRLFCEHPVSHAVLQLADPFAAELLADLPGGVVVSGCHLEDATPVDHRLPPPALLTGRFRAQGDGSSLQLRHNGEVAEIGSRLLGRYNGENLLLATAILLALGHPLATAAAALAGAGPVSGRMERIATPLDALVVVDFAHTADGLEAALRALRDHVSGEIVCLFGCGGDRDRGKRPLMGAVAERLADRLVVTDDNPRSESPQAIVAAILDGMKQPERAEVIHDREQAIGRALELATPGGGVLIAGKGHEQAQERAGVRTPFSDQAVVARWRRPVAEL